MTGDEIRAAIAASPELVVLATTPNPTGALAEALSIGRTRVRSPSLIGVGDILATLGEAGGPFLDGLVAIGAEDRNVHWAMVLVEAGRLDIGMPATRAQVSALAASNPSIAPAVAALLSLGEVPDPVQEFDVRCAIFNDDGSLNHG